MNDFERMMLQEGVRPIKNYADTRTKAEPISSSKVPMTVETAPHPIPPPPTGVTWVNGESARTTLEAAIAMAKEDRDKGRDTWITGIKQNGKHHVMRSNATLGEIISQADKEDLRLIVLAGDSWTCIMHPSMGIATIERDAD